MGYRMKDKKVSGKKQRKIKKSELNVGKDGS
jgi:hypothetical protein